MDLLACIPDLSQLPDSRVLGASHLFSSAATDDKATLIGYAPETSGDFDHGSFLRIEEVPGGVEGVLAEMNGPGAITWMWSANPVGDLVLDIDGVRTVYPFSLFLAGEWLPVRYPFAARTAEGFNLHFPIFHATSCRVSVRAKSKAELGSLFYQIAWNSIETDRDIAAFHLKQEPERKQALRKIAKQWLNPLSPVLKDSFVGELAPGTSCKAFLTAGAGMIRCLKITAQSKRDLSELDVEMYWDQESMPALTCPLSMLCGVSGKMGDVSSIPVSVKRSTVIIRWPMPFNDGAMVKLVNRSDRSMPVKVAVSMVAGCKSRTRFGGRYSSRPNLLVNSAESLTLAEIKGSGKIVGCILNVVNHGDGWWGEGDPVIGLDNTNIPAWRGTGSEDYFGCAWCSDDSFQHPLRGQTSETLSMVSMYRYHLMDALPFRGNACFQFEVKGAASMLVDYSTLLLWYSETSSRNDTTDAR